MKNDGDIYNKKVSDQLEVEKKTLKQWEKLLGAYLTIERVDGARVYTEEQIELFNDIKQLFDEQCTLDEVKEYVQSADKGTRRAGTFSDGIRGAGFKRRRTSKVENC